MTSENIKKKQETEKDEKIEASNAVNQKKIKKKPLKKS